MTSDDPDRRTAGFRERTPLSTARERLAAHVPEIEAEERVALGRADGRVLATPIASERDVPAHRLAAMDGYAIHSDDATGAAEHSPAVLEALEADSEGEAASGTARRVHTGSAVPEGADAVVPIEHVTEIDGAIELTDPVAAGQHVAPVGEDISAGQALYEPGHRLRPSDLGLLKAAGIDRVAVRRRPTVGIVPTGEELVQRDPGPGEAVETNGLTVARLAERWGARTEYRNVVSDSPAALRAAIQRDLTKDVVVTTGGTSVGERDHLPEVLDELGEVLVHGVALQPGHPVALGVVDETIVCCLPGYPVSCIVTAIQFLRPTLAGLSGTTLDPFPSERARLERKIDSEPGTTTFARVEVEDAADEGDRDKPTARPTRSRGAGVLSSVALADGWVVVPPEREGIPADETVTVEHWEANP